MFDVAKDWCGRTYISRIETPQECAGALVKSIEFAVVGHSNG